MSNNLISSMFLTVVVGINGIAESFLKRQYDLTLVQYRILLEIHASGGQLPMKSLAPFLCVTPASVTQAVKTLGAAGYVTKTAGQVDLRENFLSITEPGDRLLVEIDDRLYAEFSATAWSKLSGQELKDLFEVTDAASQSHHRTPQPKVSSPIRPTYFTFAALQKQEYEGLVRRRFGLTLTEFRVMLQIAETGGHVIAADLVKPLALTANTISMRVSTLERDGYLRRTASATDRRSVEIELTEAGETVTREALDELNVLNDRLIDFDEPTMVGIRHRTALIYPAVIGE